jgi:ubiquitin-like protein Pup
VPQQTTKTRPAPQREAPPTQAPPRKKRETAAEAGNRLKAELDGLLDEIDDVLEESAEEFVRGYIQKGGQ